MAPIALGSLTLLMRQALLEGIPCRHPCGTPGTTHTPRTAPVKDEQHLLQRRPAFRLPPSQHDGLAELTAFGRHELAENSHALRR